MYDSFDDGWQENTIVVMENGEGIGTATLDEGGSHTVRFDYDGTAEYIFYWKSGDYPNECSFEILTDDEVVFEAAKDDCSAYADDELIHTIEPDIVEVVSITIADGELTKYHNAV